MIRRALLVGAIILAPALLAWEMRDANGPAGSHLASAARASAARASATRAPARRAIANDNAPYDGRFTFVRIRYEAAGGGGGWGGRDRKWDHDYPRGERNFSRILHELTAIRPNLAETNILTLDDPDLMKYPVAYLCEPGFWTPTEEEIGGLRAYLQKGGFIIFDDFAGPHWYNFEEQFGKVLPGARLVPLDTSHPIFDSFFRIESLDFDHPNYRVKAQFLGVFEDNDPSKRLLAIVNYNNDIGDYWEWSDEGWLPIELSNQAYRLGVNYVVYALTR